MNENVIHAAVLKMSALNAAKEIRLTTGIFVRASKATSRTPRSQSQTGSFASTWMNANAIREFANKAAKTSKAPSVAFVTTAFK